ncbi:MAG: flap endonuclease-1 [Candidatus Bathyarchaeia archaeon]
MGVHLTPIILKHKISLEDLTGKTMAVDCNNVLYQFLALIRKPDGSPLKSSDGIVTSHLAGLMYRSTRLICDYGINLIFIFDGIPPRRKEIEITKRRQIREKATLEWRRALEEQDYAKAFSKAVMTSRLTKPMIEDAKRLLNLLGIPYVQAPGEAEAQAAYMAAKGDVWATGSRDFDSLLFGTPKLVRYLTLTGREFLPSKGISRRLEPELIILDELLSHQKISRIQLIDIAILIGTDFNDGVKGIGPKKALRLIREYGEIENLPESIKREVPPDYEDIRRIFLQPNVDRDYVVNYGTVKEEELYDFLCNQRGFSLERVRKVIERVKKCRLRMRQIDLDLWIQKDQKSIDL